MKNEKQVKSISKFLSLVLRHKPETIDLQLDDQGWVAVDVLLQKLSKAGKNVDLDTLKYVVENNNKKRFSFNETQDKIRANQGHSIQIDLGYEPVTPPETLYHGTATRFLDSIFQTGLEKRNRHHVHLSADLDTASQVGNRHGKLVILEVLAKQMYDDGYEFFVSKNKVWLTDSVPVKYLRQQEE